MNVDEEEFVEKLGTEYKEPIKKEIVSYRKDEMNIILLFKEKLPKDAVYMGFLLNTCTEQWFSMDYYMDVIKNKTRD